MASLAELVVKVGADIAEFTKQMGTVDSTMKSTGKGLMNVGKSVGDAGSKMATAVSLPILSLATSAVVVGASFDKQMSKVKATSGATGKQFEALRKQAIDLGASTTFSSSEVASAMDELASAGFTTGQIMSSVSGVLDLSASSGTGLAEAASIAGNAINGFGLKASDASHVADVLAKASALSATNAKGLGDAFKYVAPVASSLGLNIEETASAIGIMANAGIDGSQAGTTLRAGLLRLASPTKEASTTMKELGMSFFDSKGKMKDMNGIFSTLQKGLKGMTDEQKTQVLSTLFGTEAVSGFMAVLDAGTGKLNKNTKALKDSDGSAKSMAKTMTENLAGAWEGLTGALESLAISFSDVVKGDLQKLTGVLTNITNAFNKTSPATKKFILVFALIASAIAPALIIIGMIAQGISALGIVFGAISAPVALIVGAITLLGVAFIALWKNSQTFRDGVINVFNAVKEAVSTAIGAVVAFLQSKLAQIQEFWNQNGSQILQAVQNIWNGILAVINFVMPAVLFVIQYVWGAIKGVISGALDVIMGLVKIFAGLFTGDFSAMWEGIKQLFSGAIKLIWNLMSLSFVGSLRKIVVSLAKGLWKTISSMWDDIVIKFLYGKDKVVAVWNGIKSFASSIWGGIKSVVVSLAKGLWNGVKGVFSSLKSGISSIWNSVKSFTVNAWNSMKSRVTSLASSLKNGVVNAWNAVKSRTSSIWNSVKTAMTHPVETAKNTISGIISKIKGFFSGLHLKIPKISMPPLPHFSVSGKFSLKPPSVPKIGVSWYKTGGIFTGESLIGVGEHGDEAVVPLSDKSRMKPFAMAVASLMPDRSTDNSSDNNVEYSFTIPLYVDGREFARGTAKFTREELEKLDRKKSRLGGVN